MRKDNPARLLRRSLFLSVLFCAVVVQVAVAEVSLSINIGPPVVFAPPPAVVLVPGSRVYFVPDFDVDIFYYGGYWWSPRGERWYRAREYNGPWRTIPRASVPRPVYRVPGDYRHAYAKERHIPYGQWKKERSHRGGGKGEYRGRDDHRGRDDDRGRGRGRDDRDDRGRGRGRD